MMERPILTVSLCLALLSAARGEEGKFKPMTFDPDVELDTAHLGGAPYPTVEELVAMQKGDYALRACNGKMTRVEAEKTRLPFDPKFHPQGGIVYRATDNLIYARQATLLSKSTDGGRTWTTRPFEAPEGHQQVLNDGTFIRIAMDSGEGATGPPLGSSRQRIRGDPGSG